MEDRNNPNREATKSETFMHKWGAPLSHGILWALGLCITLNVNGILFYIDPTEKTHEGIQLLIVFIIFLFEVAVSFFSTACERRIRAVSIRIFKVIALFVLIVASTLIAAGIYFISKCSTTQLITALALIGTSSVTKGLEIWIQNNLDEYAVEIQDGDGDYESTFEQAEIEVEK